MTATRETLSNTAMLANLLPGIRDLRSPLAAGYIWLAAVWVWLSSNLPKSATEAKGLLGDIYDLGQAAGRPAIGIALSFSAYLVGVVTVSIAQKILSVPIILVSSFVSWAQKGLVRVLPLRLSAMLSLRRIRVHPDFDEAYAAVMDVLDARFQDDPKFCEQVRVQLDSPASRKRLARSDYFRGRQNAAELIEEAQNESYVRRQLLEFVVNIYSHASEVTNDLSYVPQRIVESKPKTFERYDQLRAEAEFRSAVAVPLMFLVIALSHRALLSPYVTVLLSVLPILLLMQGYNTSVKAQVQLASTVRADPTISPPMIRVQSSTLHWLAGDLTVRQGFLGASWSESKAMLEE